MITQEQFNKAMLDAIEASKQAKQTHEQRLAFYERVEAEILQHCIEEEGILLNYKNQSPHPKLTGQGLFFMAILMQHAGQVHSSFLSLGGGKFLEEPRNFEKLNSRPTKMTRNKAPYRIQVPSLGCIYLASIRTILFLDFKMNGSLERFWTGRIILSILPAFMALSSNNFGMAK